jgi:tetratricopeptide (TPR) repeat protein
MSIVRRALRCFAIVFLFPLLSAVAAEVSNRPTSRPSRPPGNEIYVELQATPAEWNNQKPVAPVLARELFRQAWLMTARDGLGVFTRDAVLREKVEPGQSIEPFSMVVDLRVKTLNLVVLSPQGDKLNEIWSRKQIPLQGHDPLDYVQLVELAHGLSRRDFVAALGAAGVPTIRRPAPNSSALPRALDMQLGELNWADQFMAIRSLHSLTREKGESSELLGGLVRGYAHLALLTDRHWSVAHKVFLSRALLYGQQMVAVSEKDPLALAYRAYALTAAGLHAAALEDLGQAKSGRGPALPAWVEVMEAACRFDNAQLEKVAGGRSVEAGLALLLRLTQDEYSNLSPRMAKLAGESLQRYPHCMRLVSVLNEQGAMSQKHGLSAYGLQIVDEFIRARLPRLNGLPADVVEHLKKLKDPAKDELVLETPGWANARADLVRLLVQSDKPDRDRNDFSWTLLGRLLEEEFFAQAMATTLFTRNVLCIESGDFVDAASRVVPEHPEVGFMKFCRFAHGEEGREGAKLLTQMPIPDADIQKYRLFWHLDKDLPPAHRQARKFSYAVSYTHSLDQTSRDLTHFCQTVSEKTRAGPARKLLAVSPHNPVAVSTLILSDWEKVQGEVGAWESTFGHQPLVLEAFGKHYEEAKETDKALSYYKRLVEIEPSMSTYLALADLHREQKHDAEFIAAIQGVLKLEETGLEHTRARTRLAEYYMEKKDFKSALPYAQKAAESGAAAGLICLADCHEGLGDFKRAEQYVRECAEHYREPERWFFWCKRTGKGDLESARAFAVETFARLNADRTPQLSPDYGTFLLLTDKPSDALKVFQAGFDRYGWMTCGMQSALLADKFKMPGLRDMTLKRMIELAERRMKAGEKRIPLSELAQIIKQAIDTDGKLDTAKITAWLDGLPDGARPLFMYYAAVALEVRGDESIARKYLTKVVQTGVSTDRETLLARQRCEQLGLNGETPGE